MKIILLIIITSILFVFIVFVIEVEDNLIPEQSYQRTPIEVLPTATFNPTYSPAPIEITTNEIASCIPSNVKLTDFVGTYYIDGYGMSLDFEPTLDEFFDFLGTYCENSELFSNFDRKIVFYPPFDCDIPPLQIYPLSEEIKRKCQEDLEKQYSEAKDLSKEFIVIVMQRK